MNTRISRCILLSVVFLLAGLTGAWGQSSQDDLNAGIEKYNHSDFRGALALFEQALALARELGDRREEGQSLGNLGNVYNSLGDYPQARRHYEQALAIFRKLGDRRGEGSSLNNLGNVYESLGDYPQARRHDEQALALARELGDRREEGQSLGNLGNVYNSLGDYPQARRHYEQALAIFRKLGDRRGEGSSLNNLGNVYESLGDYPQARRHYEQALGLARKLGDRRGEGRSLNSIGGVYWQLGDYPQARHHFEQALAIARELDDRAGESQSLGNLGAVYESLGDYPQARHHFEQALAIARELDDRQGEGRVLNNLGRIYLTLGQLADALALFQRLNNSLISLGRYYLRVGDYGKARDAFARNLKDNEKSPNPEFLLADYIGLGLAYEGLKDYAQAKEYYQKTVDFSERQREGLTEAERRYFFAATVQGFSRLEPYEGLVRVSVQLDDPTMAFHWAEHTKARLLLDAVARRYRDNALGLPDPNLARQETELDQQLASTHKQLDLAFQKNNAERQQKLEQQLPKLKQDQQTLIARLRQQYPAYAAIRYPQPLRLAELTLDPHEALIEYEVTDSATYAWLIKGNQIRKTLTVPLSRAALTEQVKRYRGFFEISDAAQLANFDPRLGQQLYDNLFKDFAPLLDEHDRIILVPDEILGILPFEALVVDAPAQPAIVQGQHGPTWPGVRYLGERYPLRYAQSATALQQRHHLPEIAAVAGTALLVVADPVFDEQDTRVQQAKRSRQPLQVAQRDEDRLKLMNAVEEYQQTKWQVRFPRLDLTGQLPGQLQRLYGQNAVEVLTGLEATKQTVSSRLTQPHRYEVLATHGILDGHLPYVQEPALVLTQVTLAASGPAVPDDPTPGFLTLTEVMNLKIPVQLVALTACSTGLGRELTGEGVMGMGRAFQYAGARHVLMSLWEVSEVTTNLLTERFFAHLKDGQESLDAVRGARADVRQAGYDHPFFWAPFILVGG